MRYVDSATFNQKYILKNPFPTIGLLELTHRCNLACFHCVRDCPEDRTRKDRVTTEDWLRVIDELADLGAMAICFTGGEATLHPGLITLIRRARERRLSVSLKTNALNLERRAPELKEAGVQIMEISLHGASPATHERVTRIRGSFEKAIAGIQAVRATGIPVTIKCNLFRWNVHEIEQLRVLASELGCHVSRDYFIINSDCGRHFVKDMLTPAQIRYVESVWPGASLPENQNKYSEPIGCTQGINSLAITADGEVLSCIQVRKSVGRIQDTSLKKLWNEQGGKMHNINFHNISRCASCSLLSRCRICIGQNYAATGDFYEPPLERCYVTMALYGKTGYTSFGKKEETPLHDNPKSERDFERDQEVVPSCR
ncbi:MAG: radical SAM protein [Candidatus Hydrogenedentota bacterium]|nr:MAG: radical SAM protein [Candidatus Hydrogenedentota bacterium]